MTRRRAGLAVALACAAALGIDAARPLPARWFAAAPDRVVVDRHGEPLATRAVLGRGHAEWVELDQVAPALIDALLAAEDHRFRDHHGIDPRAVGRAIGAGWRAGRVVQGGSTLTQQTARLLAGRPPGWLGKGLEAWRAVKLELHLDKDEILTWYLNRAYFGRGSYGIGAAARRVFDESPRSLSVSEAALLVGVLPAPERLHPEVDLHAARAARDHVLGRMEGVGALTAAQAADARAEPIELRRRAPDELAPHLVAQLLDAHPEAARITTTIDAALQREVEKAVSRQLAGLKDLAVDHAAVLVVDVPTAEVLAYVGSGGFDRPDGQVDGVRALRSPGSALKPFVYGLAFEQGVRPGDVVFDLPDRYATRAGSWAPENYDRQTRGPMRVREALATSANLPAVRMLDQVGASALHDRLRAIGFPLERATAHYGLGLALGDGEVTLEALTAAYAGLARGGTWVPLRRTDADPEGRAVPFLDPGAAAVVMDVLADPVARAPAFGRYGPLERPYWAAAKTGTSTGYRDNWTVGTAGRTTVGVWVGNFDGRPMGDVSGVTGAGPLWATVMDRATRGELSVLGLRPADLSVLGLRPAEFPPPPDPPGWHRERTCALSGGAAGPHCGHTVDDWAPTGEPPRPSCTWHRPDGLVDWPPELTDWARERGALGALPDGAPGEVAIRYPPDGTTLYVDPRIPADHQRIPLRAAAPPSAGEVEWRIDGVAVGAAAVGEPFLWQPAAKGTHEVALAVDGQVHDRVTVEIR